MVENFTLAAEAVGATVKRFLSPADAVEYLRTLAQGEKVVMSEMPAKLRDAVAALGPAPVAEAADAYLCVSHARRGIAETGSLLLDVRDTAGRGATALPRVHAVFLAASSIAENLTALRDELQELLTGPNAAYLSITTGPSRTADIERVLTIGVHGPKELHILVLEQE